MVSDARRRFATVVLVALSAGLAAEGIHSTHDHHAATTRVLIGIILGSALTFGAFVELDRSMIRRGRSRRPLGAKERAAAYRYSSSVRRSLARAAAAAGVGVVAWRMGDAVTAGLLAGFCLGLAAFGQRTAIRRRRALA